MKLRGEAWQGFKMMNNTAYQTVAFRLRRLMANYTGKVVPFNGFIFKGKLKKN